MIKREHYIFAIGYDGAWAVVDKAAVRKFGRLDTVKLADLGLFKAAYRSAVYSGSQADADYVLEKFNRVSVIKYPKSSDLAKVFGVQPPSVDITGVRAV
jgi:hypothetical protein